METVTIIENLIGELCSSISAGADKLVDYVHKVIKATGEFISTTYSEFLSSLRNLWTSLKASISSALNNISSFIKENALQGIRSVLESVFNFFNKFFFQFIKHLIDLVLPESVAESIVKAFEKLLSKITTVTQGSFLPALQNIMQKPEVSVVSPIASYETDDDFTMLSDPQKISTPHGNRILLLAQTIMNHIKATFALFTECFDEVSANIDAEEAATKNK